MLRPRYRSGRSTAGVTPATDLRSAAWSMRPRRRTSPITGKEMLASVDRSPNRALVHECPQQVRPSPLFGLFDPNRDRHAEAGHAVQYVAADLRLGPLIGQSPGAKTASNNGLVPVLGCLDETSPTISRAALPIDASMLGNR